MLLDSSDLGLVNRPRLWWTKIDWSQARTNPFSGRPFNWSKSNKIHKLALDLPLQDASQLDLDGCTLHPDVTSHQRRIPCFTTPAPTPEGRPAPKRMRGSIDPIVKQRWLSDGRRYAPWAYEETSMLRDDQGNLISSLLRRKSNYMDMRSTTPMQMACLSMTDTRCWRTPGISR